MAEQESLRKLVRWLAASEIEIAEISKCYQRTTIANRKAKKKKGDTEEPQTIFDGFLYTCIHLKLANGEQRLITWLEDHELNLKEVIIKVVDEEWLDRWSLQNWQSKELEHFDVAKLNSWWKGRAA